MFQVCKSFLLHILGQIAFFSFFFKTLFSRWKQSLEWILYLASRSQILGTASQFYFASCETSKRPLWVSIVNTVNYLFNALGVNKNFEL